MASTAFDESRLRAALEAAESAQLAGRGSEAAGILERLLAEYPGRAEVFAACGLHALRSGNFRDAEAHLLQAIALQPKDPRVHVNLASARRGLNDAAGEMAALQDALEVDPYFSVAIFQKASLLERQGKTRQAAQCYHAALASLRPEDRLPADWKPLIEHSQRMVRENYAALEAWIADRTHGVRDRFGAGSLARADHFVDIFLGKRRVYVQQPVYSHFPHLPAIEFFERADFPWLPDVEAATAGIRRELEHLLEASRDDFVPYLAHAPDAPLNQWRELNGSKRWGALFLFNEGGRVAANVERCPYTVSVLEKVPQVHIRGRGPTAFFSRLEPRTRIPAHTGVTNTRLTVHLPLIIPPGCGFRVGAETRGWEPGVALLFDDSIEHEAWNDSDEERVVLIFDVWNPLLTEAERELVRAATESIAAFYEED